MLKHAVPDDCLSANNREHGDMAMRKQGVPDDCLLANSQEHGNMAMCMETWQCLQNITHLKLIAI